MCDAEEPGDYSTSVDRTARVTHECDGCRETIRPGHRYRVHTVVFEGSWWTIKHCRRCTAMVNALHTVARVHCVDLTLDCGEVWNDPPDDFAGLAEAQ